MGMQKTVGSGRAVSITSAAATNDRCRAVYIGVSANYDFSLDGSTWVQFSNCAAGSVLPIQAKGARITSGSAAPNAGDIVFLY